MFDLIRFRADIEVFAKNDKVFIARKVTNKRYQGVTPFPFAKSKFNDLKKNFTDICEFNEFFIKNNQNLLLRLLSNHLFFEYKIKSYANFIFQPKYNAPQENERIDLELTQEPSRDAYIRNINGSWLIDSALSNYQIVFDGHNPTNDFFELTKAKMFSIHSDLDFKDTLFLHEIRRRKDLAKGTFSHEPNMVVDMELATKKEANRINMPKIDIPKNFRRMSSRSDSPLNKDQLLLFIANLMATQANLNDPYLGKVSKKFYPSAGSGYELRPLLHVNNVAGLDRGIYIYDENSNSLREVELDESYLMKIIHSSKKSWGIEYGDPSVVLQFYFNPLYYYRKYKQICLNLSLVNFGVLVSECYRLGHELDVGVCALGSIDSDYLYDSTDGKLITIGEVALSNIQ